MENIVKIDTVSDFNDIWGVETRHPLVNVIDGEQVNHPVFHCRKNFGIYVIYLKDIKCADSLKYGRKEYDFQENTLVFVSPGQVLGNPYNGTTFEAKGWCLYFSPDLLRGTQLGKHIKDYTFFSYAINEALHISKQERQTIVECLKQINEEINGASDRHSNMIIASTIELLLNYCIRFYDRQFVTRKQANKDILSSFEELLDGYFLSEKPQSYGTPTVAYCAEQLHLSANYFGDLIKKETGKSAQEQIQQKIMEAAKSMLVGTGKTVSEIAYYLGYQYPQYFSRAFKKIEGCTPNEYRVAGRL